MPSESVAVAVKLTVSPALPSVSAIVRSPPEILTDGETFGASTVMVAVVDVDAPSLSVALKVTTVAPLPKLIEALVPVATSDPPTNHCVEAIVPSLSVAVAVKLTVSPALPSVSAIVRSPPEILIDGCALAPGSRMVIET